MRGAGLIATGLLGLLPSLCGCNIIAGIGYLTAPPQIRKAEFELTEGRLAILIENARPEEENAVFRQAFQQRLEEVFRDRKKINAVVVPRDEVLRLRQRNSDFSRWSLQKVARRLDAQQLLYVRIERFQMRDAPDDPVLHPAVRLRLKVIDPGAPPELARLWPGPEERHGREVARHRHEQQISDLLAFDAEAAKLGKDAAYLAAMPFYDVDLEEKPPWEP